MRIPLAASLAAAALLAFDAAAQSNDHVGYVGAGIGMVSIPSADDAPWMGTDTSMFAGNIYAGVSFNDFIGVEVGYLKSTKGDVKASNSDTGLDYDMNTIHGALVGRLPIESGASPFGKIGFHRWKVGASATRDGVTVSLSETGTDLMLGAGIDWAMNESWTLRAEYMFVPYDAVGSDYKAHAFLVGAHRMF